MDSEGSICVGCPRGFPPGIILVDAVSVVKHTVGCAVVECYSLEICKQRDSTCVDNSLLLECEFVEVPALFSS